MKAVRLSDRSEARPLCVQGIQRIPANLGGDKERGEAQKGSSHRKSNGVHNCRTHLKKPARGPRNGGNLI